MKYWSILPFIVVSLIFTSCEETMPPRVVPEAMFIGKLRFANDTHYVIIPHGTEKPELTTFKLGVENKYEETMDGETNVRGTVNIYIKTDKGLELCRTLRHNYSAHVTIDPGSTYWITLVWDQIDKNGKPIWDYIDPDKDIPENTTVSKPMKFIAVGDAKIFEKVPSVGNTMEFQVVIFYKK